MLPSLAAQQHVHVARSSGVVADDHPGHSAGPETCSTEGETTGVSAGSSAAAPLRDRVQDLARLGDEHFAPTVWYYPEREKAARALAAGAPPKERGLPAAPVRARATRRGEGGALVQEKGTGRVPNGCRGLDIPGCVVELDNSAEPRGIPHRDEDIGAGPVETYDAGGGAGPQALPVTAVAH